MPRLKYLILIFCAALSVPLGYVVWHTHHSLKQEEIAELRYFAGNLFERMEEELAELIRKEEARAVDDYTYPRKQDPAAWTPTPFPDAKTDDAAYILGYLQNNPDGSFQTPLFRNPRTASSDPRDRARVLRDVNDVFNRKRSAVVTEAPLKPAAMIAATKKEKAGDIADKYFDLSRSPAKKSYLGHDARRVEKIPARQALNIAPYAEKMMTEFAEEQAADETIAPPPPAVSADLAAAHEGLASPDEIPYRIRSQPLTSPSTGDLTYRVEVDPMQSVLIDHQRVFVFRRIVVTNRIYRQGFILSIKDFLHHLADTHFSGQPMARFTRLRLGIVDRGQEVEIIQAGTAANAPVFSLRQRFPRPFGFIQATLDCDRIPASGSRLPLNITMGLTTAILLIGLLAIYHSAAALVELSERRAAFVSSVTHELKTPLTNIRMYIEMLEQGIARTRDREQAYFGILLSESARLSRLINNVLEFSRLEKKQRQVNLEHGTLQDVIGEVSEVMEGKLNHEGFVLHIEQEEDRGPFAYDREMMVQILLNLLENSIKFGRHCNRKEITIRVRRQNRHMEISVADTGPGIPQAALKKVFDDFFRVDSEIVRNTGGTGIGLALVKKFVTAMGGRVKADNHTGPGCTISLLLPL